MSNERLRNALGPTPVGDNPVRALSAFLETRLANLTAILPKHMDAVRLTRIAVTVFANNPTLQKCTQLSIYASLLQAATFGLEIGTHAHLVPYKQKNGTYRCQLIPDYRGLLELIRRTGLISSVRTEIVYTDDVFDLNLGENVRCIHRPNLDRSERGQIRLVYGVAEFTAGGRHFEWMSKFDIDAIRSRSRASSDGPWITDYGQMARKTLIRRMAHYLPSSVELRETLELDRIVSDGGMANVIDGVVSQALDEEESQDNGNNGQEETGNTEGTENV